MGFAIGIGPAEGGERLGGLLASTGGLSYLLDSASQPGSQHEKGRILRKTPNLENLLKTYGLCNQNRARWAGERLGGLALAPWERCRSKRGWHTLPRFSAEHILAD